MPNIVAIRIILLTKCGWGINTIVLIMINKTWDKRVRALFRIQALNRSLIKFRWKKKKKTNPVQYIHFPQKIQNSKYTSYLIKERWTRKPHPVSVINCPIWVNQKPLKDITSFFPVNKLSAAKTNISIQ